jgi:Adenylate and Guanylate cyclase catalytic domain
MPSGARSRCSEGMADREPEERRIKFRIGINLGGVIAEEHDIFGDGVNVAARPEALAESGGICISRTVRDHIRDKLPYPLEDMGEQSVKNIARARIALGADPLLHNWRGRAVVNSQLGVGRLFGVSIISPHRVTPSQARSSVATRS